MKNFFDAVYLFVAVLIGLVLIAFLVAVSPIWIVPYVIYQRIKERERE